MIKGKVAKVRQEFTKKGLDAVLISSVSNIIYLTGFTGFSMEEREAYIFIGKDFAYIITDGRYTEAVRKEVPHLTLFERDHKKTIASLFKKHRKVKHLGIEEDNLTVAEHQVFSKHFKKTKHFDVSNLRSIKTVEEISKIKKACQIGDLAFKFILKKIRSGVSEKKLAQELENFIKDKGAEISFPTIVAFSNNSATPHHLTGHIELTDRGGFVLLDFGVRHGNYCSDMTRTVFLGNPDDKQKEIYQIVLEAQQKAVDYINSILKSGKKLKASDVDKVARRHITSKGYPTIPHSLGHGIGLEVHEHPSLSPKSRDELREGMVFSIEPGVYLPGFGGVRIEDLYVIEKGKLKQITQSSRNIISVKI